MEANSPVHGILAGKGLHVHTRGIQCEICLYHIEAASRDTLALSAHPYPMIQYGSL